MGSSDDVAPVTKGFVDDIQRVAAIEFSFITLETAGVCWRYFRRLLWSRCESSVLDESVEKNDSGMWQPCSLQ